MGLSTCKEHTVQSIYYDLLPPFMGRVSQRFTLDLAEYFNILSVNHSILVHALRGRTLIGSF